MYIIMARGKYIEKLFTGYVSTQDICWEGTHTSKDTLRYWRLLYNPLWDGAPGTYLNNSQVLQNRAPSIMCDSFDWNVSVSALVMSLVGLALEKYGVILSVCIMYICLKTNVPVYLCEHLIDVLKCSCLWH